MKRFATKISQQLGAQGESLFASCLGLGQLAWAPASYQDNAGRHIDFQVFGETSLRRDAQGVTNIDVKGLKRLRAAPQFQPQSRYLTIEIEAANHPLTRSGWLYDGASQYIAFQLDGDSKIDSPADRFLLTERKYLRDFVDASVDFDSCVKHGDQAVYKKYTRMTQGRHRGSITLIPLYDVVEAVRRSVILTSHGNMVYLV